MKKLSISILMCLCLSSAVFASKISLDVGTNLGFSPAVSWGNNSGNDYYSLDEALEDNIIYRFDVNAKVMLKLQHSSWREDISFSPFIGFGFSSGPEILYGLGFNFNNNYIELCFGNGTLEYSENFNNKRNWHVGPYSCSKSKIKADTFDIKISYSYFVKGTNLYFGICAGYEFLTVNTADERIYCSNSPYDYYYNTKSFKGNTSIFQLKAGYRFGR